MIEYTVACGNYRRAYLNTGRVRKGACNSMRVNVYLKQLWCTCIRQLCYMQTYTPTSFASIRSLSVARKYITVRTYILCIRTRTGTYETIGVGI